MWSEKPVNDLLRLSQEGLGREGAESQSQGPHACLSLGSVFSSPCVVGDACVVGTINPEFYKIPEDVKVRLIS